MKSLIILGLLALIPVVAHASGEDRDVTVDPTYEYFGNTQRNHNVNLSTRNAVLLSSTAADATVEADTTTTLGIYSWRFREIINVSTCAALAIYSTNIGRYNVYSTTYAIIASSDSSGLGAGDVYVVPHQDQVWGIWTNASGNGSCAAGAGSVTEEVYQSSTRKK